MVLLSVFLSRRDYNCKSDMCTHVQDPSCYILQYFVPSAPSADIISPFLLQTECMFNMCLIKIYLSGGAIDLRLELLIRTSGRLSRLFTRLLNSIT